MNQGYWVWPESLEEQGKIIRNITDSKFLRQAIISLARNSNGLSNAEIDQLIDANSNWLTLWVMRQLMALGLVIYKVELFGGPGRYQLTQRGKEVAQRIISLIATAPKTE
jgi:hypothetical protein